MHGMWEKRNPVNQSSPGIHVDEAESSVAQADSKATFRVRKEGEGFQ